MYEIIRHLAKLGARTQPITQNLALFLQQHIKQLPKGTEWLFSSMISPTGHIQRISKAFRRVVNDAG